MKNDFKLIRVVGIVLAIFSVISCEQNVELDPIGDQDEKLSEIELLEKKTGITFFKKEVTVKDESGKNSVTMRVASKSEVMLETYLRTIDFSISPIYLNEDQLNSPTTPKSVRQQQSALEGASGLEDDNTNGVFIEVLSQSLQNNVGGLRTDFKLKDRKLSNGRTAVPSDFPNEVHHYNTSGHWPERFKMYAYQTVGYKFMGKTNRFSGWSTRNFCDWFNSADCNTYWEHGGEKWINIDGPWDVRAHVYYFYYSDYSFEWNNL